MSDSNRGIRIIRLTGGTDAPAWTIAVFAHNERRLIRTALASIPAAAGGRPIRVVVLANGCSDDTSDRVRACTDLIADLTLVEIDLGDKANAWNTYIHEYLTTEAASRTVVHFFTDGDVRLEPNALVHLAETFAAEPMLNAVGGLPTTGRNREVWRQRMLAGGSLAGNLYSLRDSFVRTVRERQLRMPIGLFGEDRFVSWMVDTDFGTIDRRSAARRAFHLDAGFAFDSLSPWRIRDYRIFLRRQWRYARRGVQHDMLMPMILKGGLSAIPPHIEDVYRYGPIPSRLRWIGLGSPWRFAAVHVARSFRPGEKKIGRPPAGLE
jgi:glycosyltransferase involved in cell wall biosynthesis